MIVCQVCGTQNPDGARFCDGCGVELAATPTSSSPEVRESPLPESSTFDSNVVPPTPPLPQPEVQEPISQSTPLEVPTPEASTPETPATPEIPAADVLEEPLEDVQPSTPEAVPAQESTSVPAAPEATSEPTPEAAPEPAPVPTPAPVSSGPVPAKLAIKKYGVLSGDSIPLVAGALTVGRFDASTGPVDIDVTGLPGSEHVSRRHAQVFFEDGRWKVKDLGSTNGVFLRKSGDVNFGPRLAEPTALSNGDEIAFGNLLMIFQED
ncbi:FHA domain-containing protein [Deinococcus roseus]|uniref:FraH-like protein n=1 Tax=Deinococcus roseus TaxID=392414 RepID=A0ABQ2DK04_9DEIO|nr:FHA domain-containing protein [Deinococcus roseus]GGJ56265.1 FraH-like protein [Deinococcus roseus]